MATFLEIKDRVARRIIDQPTAFTTEVDALVNRALREIQERHNWNVMMETASYVTTVDSHKLGDLPSDYKEMREKPYEIVDADGTQGFRLLDRATTREEIIRMGFSVDSQNDTGEPHMIVEQYIDAGLGVATDQFQVFPLPDNASEWSDGDYRVNVPYWAYLPVLAGDGDTNWFTLNADWLLTHLATAYAFGLNWDDPREDRNLAFAVAEFARLSRQDKLSRLRKGVTIVPKTGARATRYTTNRRL